ncbi:periplasmic binding protein-like I [Obelidium mucronatum]|nr:periplasmic binding protein-like I [Obelidium mucronatum]
MRLKKTTPLFIILLATYPALCQTFVDPIIGFYPGTSTIPSKHKTNITIAFIFPYRSFWNFATQEEYDQCMFCSWMRQMDSGAEMAVQEVNNRVDILPDTMVNILRVQGWNQQSLPGAGIGGAAPVALELATNHNIVGAVGDVADQSTMITAGILSQFKIPMCGGTQNLPALSDKDNYPYFFRVTFSNKWGNDIAILLKHWKVGRVAMVYDADEIESAGACMDIKGSLFAANIVILSSRRYHGLRSDNDFRNIVNEFLLVDARYIILCAQAWSNSYYLVDEAEKAGLINSEHVWVVTQPPYPPDYGGRGPDSRLDKLVGMIWPTPKNAPPEDPNFMTVQNKWRKLYEGDALKYQVGHLTWTNAGTYDCSGTMLHGIDKVLRTNTSLTPAMLASHQLQEYLSVPTFSNTGFKGTLLNPMKLDSAGDLAANTIFISFNRSFWVDGGQAPFAEIDKFSRELLLYGDPRINGVLPNDGAIVLPLFLPSIHNYQGKFIVLLLSFGYITCTVLFWVLIRSSKTMEIRTLHVGHTAISLVGSICILSSFICYLVIPTAKLCYFRRWVTWTGISLLIGPMFLRGVLIFIVYSKRTVQKGALRRCDQRLFLCNFAIAAGNCGILAYWSFYNEFRPIAVTSSQYILYECSSLAISTHTGRAMYALYSYNALLLVGLGIMAFLNRHVRPVYNETS